MPLLSVPRYAPPDRIFLYHITSWRNLEGMLTENGIWCSRELEGRGIQKLSAAHPHIRERRAKFEVPHYPHGTLADYVPWSFAPRQPMLCSLAHLRIDNQEVRQRDMVHLVTTLKLVEKAQLQWVFTDGHPLVFSTKFFTNEKELDRVDWPLMEGEWWNNTNEDGGRTRRRQAEFLIHNFVPWSLVRRIGTKTEQAAEYVRGLLPASEKPIQVQVIPQWYFLAND